MKAKKLHIFELVLVISIAFLPSLIQSISYIVTAQVISPTSNSSSFFINSIFVKLLSIALLGYVLFRNGKNFKNIGLSLKFSWKDLVIGLGLIIIAGVARSIVTLILKFFDPDIMKQITPKNIIFLDANAYLLILFIFILSPIQEALIIRGYTMTEIFNITNSKYLAVIISVLIQFSYHLYQGVIPAIMLLPYFIVISLYFVKTSNLNPIIFSHILTDLLYFFIFIYPIHN